MTYSVIVTRKAKDDLRHYYAVAAEHAPETAARWLHRFEDALQTLSTNPTRCPLAPENDLVVRTIYQFFYGKRLRRYRALFTIAGSDVLVLHIRRGTMDKAAEVLGISQRTAYYTWAYARSWLRLESTRSLSACTLPAQFGAVFLAAPGTGHSSKLLGAAVESAEDQDEPHPPLE